MSYIPAICLDPNCYTIFSTSFNLKGHGNAVFKDCIAAPCPKCGGRGKIPNGSYRNLENRLFAFLESTNDLNLLRAIAATIQRDLRRDKSPKNIKKKLTKNFPNQISTWNLIPKIKEDARYVINLILAIILAAAAVGSCSKESRPTITNQYFNNLYLNENHENKPRIPYDSHTKDIATPYKKWNI